MQTRRGGTPLSTRIDAVDWLRGLVMVLMALDHVRDYFSNLRVNPEDPSASPALFFTRWVTHFCAPTFVLLAGSGAYLYGAGGRPRLELARFLLSRGLWLVFLGLTLVRFSVTFNFDYHFLFGEVIWVIGWSMVLLSALVWLRAWAVGLLGVVIVAGHNALDSVTAEQLGLPGWLWTVLHRQGIVEMRPGYFFFVIYPLLPWFGVLAAGYGLGPLLRLERRRQILLTLGLALTAVFVALRWSNLYGDPRPWEPMGDGLRTLMSFLNCTKYPPSLLFVCMTLGPALVALALADPPAGPLARPLVTFGRVPLFYFLVHFLLIHAAAVAVALVRHGRCDWLLANPGPGAPPPPPDAGFGLAGVYVVWVLVVLAMYGPCRWYAGVKRRHPGGVLSYL
jgi:uncharacterized membrane protein